MTFVCTKCEIEKKSGDFYYWIHKGERKRKPTCKICYNIRATELRQGRKAKTRLRTQAKKYGLTPLEIFVLEVSSQGICPICQNFDRELVIDHCHDTGVVRGLLCRQCNSGLGMFGDSSNLLLRALTYLKKSKNGIFVE